jgi:hypothetical protein
MKSKGDALRGMSATDGGSESWAQFDFELYKKQHNLDYESPTIREKHVYNPLKGKEKAVRKRGPKAAEEKGDKRAADLVFPPIPGGQAGLIVELKVE